MPSLNYNENGNPQQERIPSARIFIAIKFSRGPQDHSAHTIVILSLVFIWKLIWIWIIAIQLLIPKLPRFINIIIMNFYFLSKYSSDHVLHALIKIGIQTKL